MPTHTDFLKNAATILKDRSVEYGPPSECFGYIANLATVMLGRPVTKREVAAVHIATKLARLRETPTHADSVVDLINYAAFMGEFAEDEARNERSVSAAATAAVLDAVLRPPTTVRPPAPGPVVTS